MILLWYLKIHAFIPEFCHLTACHFCYRILNLGLDWQHRSCWCRVIWRSWLFGKLTFTPDECFSCWQYDSKKCLTSLETSFNCQAQAQVRLLLRFRFVLRCCQALCRGDGLEGGGQGWHGDCPWRVCVPLRDHRPASVGSHYRGGVQKTETMLTSGATITGVGEVVLGPMGVKLLPPEDGKSFFLVDSLKSLIKEETNYRNFVKFFLYMFSGLGLFIGGYMAWKYLNILKREAEIRQDFVLFSSLPSDSISSNLLYTVIWLCMPKRICFSFLYVWKGSKKPVLSG